MPLQLSDTQAATESNFNHQRHGKKFKRTAKKYGKKRAQKQLIAIVLSNKRKAKKMKRKKA